ncbi:tetraspanin-2 [Bombina bombina]|uniref:tetraspanin-2 n=1 Tax=Bombina bombina TaxID=8345 RepID=UPI00235ABD58|nr:tetraspanin-2 [Bombina bombina]
MGRLSGALRCVKYLLLMFNLIFLLAGSAIIAIGLWLRFGADLDDLNKELSSDLEVYDGSLFMGLYVLIGAGALMMIIGFFGCCGAARESQCLLGAFFACLLVIFAAEVTAGAFSFLGKHKAVTDFQDKYKEAYEQNNNQTLSAFHKVMKCCGNNDPQSAKNVNYLCPDEQKEHKDCLLEIEKIVHREYQIVGILAISTAGITIFGMIFSMVLCCAIRNSRDML